MIKKKYILLASIFLLSIASFSQDIFEKVYTDSQKLEISEKPNNYKQFKLNKSKFLGLVSNSKSKEQQNSASVVISLPTEKGDFEKFEVFEATVLSKELSAKYPMIKSYVGRSLKGTSTVRFSYSPSQGLNAAISNNKSATLLIKPSDIKSNTYVSFLRSDMVNQSEFEFNTIA
jgi:hypothetical protein